MTDILLIEDDVTIATLVCDFLQAADFSCEHVTTGEAGLKYLDTNKVRLVLLDIMLPGMDGFSVCKEIHQNRNIPTIILSAKTDKDDKLLGMELGADDYIEKPYDIDLLIAKVKALYRRYYQQATTLEVAGLSINTEARAVSLAGSAVAMTAKEYELLLLLVQNEGKVLKKEYLFNNIWGIDSFTELQTLTVHIKWLRQKIEKDPKKPALIQTVWGVGYKFVGETK